MGKDSGERGSYRGMCAWCFRSFRSARDRVVQRHGWVEVSAADGVFVGGRHVGEYGNVIHEGDCPGMEYPPYELSCEGTRARLKVERERVAQCDHRLDVLGGRPSLIENGSVWVRIGGTRSQAAYQVKLVAGERIEIHVEDESWPAGRRERFDYEHALGHRVAIVTAEMRTCVANVKLCEDMIAKWKPAELKVYAPREATVHYKVGRATYCGNAKSYGLRTTQERGEVTCSRCTKALVSEDAAKAAEEARQADARRIFSWLLEHGPATSKECKAALGIDQKTLNRAIDDLSPWRTKGKGDCITQDFETRTFSAARANG